MKIAVLAAAVTLAAPTALAAARHPTLTVTTAPLVVHGRHFAVRERLRVVVSSAGQSWSRVARTSATGTFSLSLGFASAYDPCLGPLAVTATGPADHVSAKVPPRECPPPP